MRSSRSMATRRPSSSSPTCRSSACPSRFTARSRRSIGRARFLTCVSRSAPNRSGHGEPAELCSPSQRRGLSMRHAALTLMALSALSACADVTDTGVPTYNNALAYYNPANAGTANPGNPNNATTNNNPPFFTTDPAYFANPPAYATDPYYVSMMPYYYTGGGYFISS